VHLEKEIIDLKVNVQDQEVQDELALEVIILGVHEDLEITTHEVMILNQAKDDQEVHEDLEITTHEVMILNQAKDDQEVHEDLEITTHEVMILNQAKDDQEVHEDLKIDNQDILEVQIVLKGQFLGTNLK
jgi:hypothetical protein